MTLDDLLRAALVALVRGRRLEAIELLLLLAALPTLVTGLGLRGVGALALAEAVVALVLHVAPRRTRAGVVTGIGAVLAVAVALPTGTDGAALAGLLVATARSGPAWALRRLLETSARPLGPLPGQEVGLPAVAPSHGTLRLLGGGAALTRWALAFALADRPEAVVVIAAGWVLVDVVAAWVGWAQVRATRGPATSGEQDGPSLNAGALWHLDALLVAGIAGVEAMAPWALGVWITGRLMALSGMFERALSPLPVPGVPDDLALQRASDAAAWLALTLAMPVAFYAGDAARLLLGVDAPWLGLFGPCLLVAAGQRTVARAAPLAGRGLAAPLGPRELALRLSLGMAAVVAVGAAGALLVTLGWAAARLGVALRATARALPALREGLSARLTRGLLTAAAVAALAATLRTLAPPHTGLELSTHVTVVTLLCGVTAFAVHHIAGGPGDSPLS